MRAVRLWTLTAVAAACSAVPGGALAAEPGAGFRPLAPGVLTVVPPPASPPGAVAATDTVSRGDLPDVTVGRADMAWKPLQSPPHTTFVERGRDREFPRDVWHLEFAFKPPRMIDVDVPAGDMKMRRKRIWYLVYRVRNAGGRRPVIDVADAAVRKTEAFETPIRFVPLFVLESREPLADGEGLASYRAYLDRVVPTALGPIRAKEGGGRELLDSAAMVAEPIGPGEERWGVATWEDVDPRIDFFSIFVRGLTNALQWRQRPGARVSAAEAPGQANEQALRTLRLDFWRPGDDRDEVEEEMSVGFAGMFERMSLGGWLLEAVASDGVDAARPTDGLRALDLAWPKLLEPMEADEGGGGVGTSLLPLQDVIAKIAAIPDPAARGPVVRSLFGDVGVVAFEDLARALAAPTDPERDRERRAALATLELSPEEVERQPLAALATIVRALEAERTPAARRAAATRFFGPASPRVEWLMRRVAMARTLAALEALEVPGAEIVAGDARDAFEAVKPALEAEPDPAKRSALLRGLFGSRGPGLFAEAARVDEGIDHSWVFRYESEVPSP